MLLLRIDNSSQSKIPHARSRTVEGSVHPYWRHECLSTSWLSCLRLFITIEVDSIIVPVLLNDYDAASGGLVWNCGKKKTIIVFAIGFWLPDMANNVNGGSSNALANDLTGKLLSICIYMCVNSRTVWFTFLFNFYRNSLGICYTFNWLMIFT